MTQPSSSNALQIAYDLMERAQQLADLGRYADAHQMLNKAKSYAFGNTALLDGIRIRQDAFNKVRRQFIKRLEEEAASIFRSDRFDSHKAREVLQTLRDEDSGNELAESLWAELPAKEAAERERRLVQEFQRKLEQIWATAQELEKVGSGARAIEKYEQALAEASKAAGGIPDSIPLQHLKIEASKKRNRAKEKWEGTRTLIIERKGRELVERYEMLKSEGEEATEFFDEDGELVGRLPVDECIRRAKEMASRFADQKSADYLGQARELLEESPAAAYNKIREALSLAYLGDLARSSLERELRDKIEPARRLRQEASAKLKEALSNQDAEEAWLLLRETEQLDAFTPGLEDARQRLYPIMLQKFNRLLDEGQSLQELEDFETARTRLRAAADVAQRFLGFGEEFQDLYPRAQKAIEQCIQAEKKAEEFDLLLEGIAQQSQGEPEVAKRKLENLAAQTPSPQAQKEIERLRVQVEFRLDIEQLSETLEQKMRSAKDDVELIPIEEAANKACLDYPGERRLQRLMERISARRFYLRGKRLKEDPERRLKALELFQRVISQNGDDAAAAQLLIDEISLDEQQEANIAAAIQEAREALASGDARLAFLHLESYRYAVSRQASQIRQLLSKASTQWQDDVERQLTNLVNSGDLSLAKVELLLDELKRSQSPRLEEWKVWALAPALTKVAKDLQELNKWEEANEMWEQAFRLAPSNPRTIEGRRNAQKQRALLRAQMTFDPVEKEQLLNDLNSTYTDDLTIKRHLAEFYYAQQRYLEARMAISQAMLLSDNITIPELTGEIEAIRILDSLTQEAEEIKRRKLSIQSQMTGQTMIDDLWQARMAAEQLIQDFPGHAKKLQRWWTDLTGQVVDEMMAYIAELSTESGRVWERAEMSCKILALQANDQIRRQSERLLRLTYERLPNEVKSVIDNPQGIGYGPASEALTSHIAEAKKLQKKLITMGQAERILANLEITPVEPSIDLENALYDIELMLEKLYAAQEARRKIKSQIDVAMMAEEWEPIEDSLKQLELNELSEHRGLKSLISEVQKAQENRMSLLSIVKQIETAMIKEEFELVQEKLQLLCEKDPADEALLQSNLEVIDPYTHQKIRGHINLSSIISAKLDVLNKLAQWEDDAKPAVDWQVAHLKIKEFAGRGEFARAIGLCQAVAGRGNEHQSMFEDKIWSLDHLRHYLDTPPISSESINSVKARSLLDKANRTIHMLDAQIAECHSLSEELQQQGKEFSQILDSLKPLLERLNVADGLFGFFFKQSTEIQEARNKASELLERGRQLCPNYPAFRNLEKDGPISQVIAQS